MEAGQAGETIVTPTVSILVPCYNESATIEELLRAIWDQDYPRGEMEVVIADGMSIDSTRALVASFAGGHPSMALRLIDNPEQSIPSALNRAIAASTGSYCLRLDAHSVPASDYVSRCLVALKTTGAANVGGQWRIEPGAGTWIARSIAAAAADPLGAGDARYRTGGSAGPVDTVPFGAYPREWLERVGGYDESLATNEDYELNWRLRQAGGIIWFDPAIQCTYFARPRLRDLARQYLRYGYWKAQMARRHPGSLRWRQVLPPLFVLGLLGLGVFGMVLPSSWTLLLVLVGMYLLVLLARGIVMAARRRQSGMILGIPVALAVFHLCWGAAFLAGVIVGPRRRTLES